MSDDKLKPCPFCGGKAYVDQTARSEFFKGVSDQYQEWRGDMDEDRCYDEIMEFVETLGRSDLFTIFEHIHKGE